MMDLLIIILATLFSIGFSIAGTLLIRNKFGHEHLSRHNDVAGFIYAVIGVIYAVLIAFVVIVVWEDYQEANGIVEGEANTISSLQALSKGFDTEYSSKLNSAINVYIKKAVNEDWKLMTSKQNLNKIKEKPSDKAFNALIDIYYSFSPASHRETMLLDKSIDKLEKLGEYRQLRFFSTKLSVPGFMWFVLSIGAVLVISFAMLFSSANLWAQLIMISVLSTSISLVLLLILALDHPYIGIIKVGADSLLNLL